MCGGRALSSSPTTKEVSHRPSKATEVLDHHLKGFAERDLDGVLADYLADAVLFGR